jgi:hypothetical protein
MSAFESAVLNWDSVIHKGVRTKDGSPLGIIAYEEQDFIVVLSSRFREYKIPKSHVENFDGSQVSLDIMWKEIGNYRM